MKNAQPDQLPINVFAPTLFPQRPPRDENRTIGGRRLGLDVGLDLGFGRGWNRRHSGGKHAFEASDTAIDVGHGGGEAVNAVVQLGAEGVDVGPQFGAEGVDVGPQFVVRRGCERPRPAPRGAARCTLADDPCQASSR